MNKTILAAGLILFLSVPLSGLGTVASNQNPRVIISKIGYDYKLLDYRLFFNGERVFMGQEINDLTPGQEYEFKVLDETNRLVHIEQGRISTSARQYMTASEPWSRYWCPRVSIMGGSWFSGGLDYFINRYTWFGAGMGASWWYRIDVASSFFLLNPYLEYGSYYIGDRTSSLRIGLGARINFHLGFPAQAWTDLARLQDPEAAGSEPSSLSVELFSTTEYDIWTLGVAIRMDLGHPRFQLLPTIGMKF